MSKAICMPASNQEEDILKAFSLAYVTARDKHIDLFIVIPSLGMPNYSALNFLKSEKNRLIKNRIIELHGVPLHLRSQTTLTAGDNSKILFTIWPSKAFAEKLFALGCELIVILPYTVQDMEFWGNAACCK